MPNKTDASLPNPIDPTPSHEPTNLSSAPSRSVWEHPMTLLLLGFLLTGVLGTLISAKVQSRAAETERERHKLELERDQETRHYESSTKALVDFSNALYVRYVRAGMLKSALSRGAPVAEVRHRKELYDEALVQQETTVLSSHLLIREALKEQDYDYWESHYQNALKPRLSDLDKKLTTVTDAYLSRPKKGIQLFNKDSASIDELYAEVRVCDSAIVNAVFRSLSSKEYLSGDKVIDTQQKAKDDVIAQCPIER